MLDSSAILRVVLVAALLAASALDAFGGGPRFDRRACLEGAGAALSPGFGKESR